MSRSPRLAAAALASVASFLALTLTVSGPAVAAPGPTAEPALAPLVTPVLSPRRLPALLASTITDASIRAAVQPSIDAALPDTCILVTDHGRVIVDYGTKVVDPASTVKLLTAVAVLETLDPNSHLRTSARSRAAAKDGVVDGDLYMVGGGDPVITTPGYEVSLTNRDQLLNDLGQLADNIAASGVREITGGIVGDDSRYDQQRWVATWPTRYQNQGFVGPMSALMVNDGQTGFSDTPDDAAKNRVPGDPPALAAATLRTLLDQRGVRVGGGASAGRAPEGTTEVAGLDSASIRDIVQQMLVESDDTTAESLTKELGVATSGEGTTAAGVRAIVDRLTQDGLSVAGLTLNDGSGLDEGSRLPCGLLSAILDRAGPDSELAKLLAVSGETGTLRPRMRRTPAQGQVFAKTGTLDHVNALAGFARMSNGQQLTFVYAVVGDQQPRGYIPIDEFAIALVTAPTGPDVEQLAPKSG
jgi:D-alanyl-D-alanine carboxypeptidase/D-alanyl-D-alanine-endopeptidase (penicillin-binding protein 4)